MEKETINVLKAFGIGAGVIVLIGAVAVGMYAYGKILETRYLSLQIKQAKRDLGIDYTT